MIKWPAAYDRSSKMPEFAAAFGGRVLPMSAFRYIAYSQRFEGVVGSSSAGTFGTQSGPTPQNFPVGGVVLGITASAFQAQQAHNAADYAPSYSPGRRDLFGLNFQYSQNEQITANGMTMAEALLGSGEENIFPAKELVIPTSQSILCAVAALTASTLPNLTVTVVYHTMVPRAVG